MSHCWIVRSGQSTVKTAYGSTVSGVTGSWSYVIPINAQCPVVVKMLVWTAATMNVDVDVDVDVDSDGGGSSWLPVRKYAVWKYRL